MSFKDIHHFELFRGWLLVNNEITVISITIITLTIWNNHYLYFKEIHLVAAVGCCKELWAAGTLSFRSLTIEEYYHYYFIINVHYLYNDDIHILHIIIDPWRGLMISDWLTTVTITLTTSKIIIISISITSIMSIPSHVYTHSWLSTLLLPTIDN